MVNASGAHPRPRHHHGRRQDSDSQGLSPPMLLLRRFLDSRPSTCRAHGLAWALQVEGRPPSEGGGGEAASSASSSSPSPSLPSPRQKGDGVHAARSRARRKAASVHPQGIDDGSRRGRRAYDSQGHPRGLPRSRLGTSNLEDRGWGVLVFGGPSRHRGWAWLEGTISGPARARRPRGLLRRGRPRSSNWLTRCPGTP